MTEVPFQFTIGSLFRATIFAAACVFMFTMPIGSHLFAARVMAGFAFGRAAIGTLFERGGYGGDAGGIGILGRGDDDWLLGASVLGSISALLNDHSGRRICAHGQFFQHVS